MIISSWKEGAKLLGDRLKQARKVKNLTQRQLADLIGVKHNSISDWEKNLHKPDVDQIKKLCGALEINPNQLYGEIESELIRKTPSSYYLTDDGKELPAEAKEELDNFIEYLKTKYKKG